jgi:hypothetical protein
MELPRGQVQVALEAGLRDWGRDDVAVALCLQRVAHERRLVAMARDKRRAAQSATGGEAALAGAASGPARPGVTA